MKSSHALYVTVASLALVSGAAIKRDEYANFFDDAHCSVNGGIGVNLGNTGCLSEAGRQSVYIPNDGGGAWILNTFGSNSDCSGNPDSSWSFTATGFCHPLNPSDQSYTFTQNMI
ncbi:hypothetical protein EHS25_004352 [Saitozyma podzolica]|uniref:Cyanovirin-N domain-containing protein n=1 Tax=Saitozyma podzolica TaxID=1890683 RepID=A0A427YTT8_9TREE|nr:hypothetical protein EHS25_004352 [Saitozyma podzolica]